MSDNLSANAPIVKPSILDRWNMAVRMLKALPGSRVIRLAPGSKQPASGVSWKADGTSDPHEVKAWLMADHSVNLGLCPGERAVIVDLDVKSSDGVKAWQALESIFGEAPTLTVETPSGGRHLYFILPSGPAGNAHSFPPGIDVRGAGGYVALPGSTLPSGCYVIARDAAPTVAPDWIKDRLRPKAEKDADRDHEPAGGWNLPESIDRARQFLKSRKPAVEGDGGDTHTFVTFCHLRDLGVSMGKALDIVAEDWNSRCEPPWSPDELATKARNAYAYATKKAGAKGGGLMADYIPPSAVDIAAPKDPAASKRPKFYPEDEDEQDAAPPLDWIVEDVLARGQKSVILGAPKNWKTFLALTLAGSVAAGTPWADYLSPPKPANDNADDVPAENREPYKPRGGFAVERPGKVLYVVVESANVFKRERRAAWRKFYARHYGEKLAGRLPLYVVNCMPNLLDGEERAQFVADVERRMGKPDLVVFDTLAKLVVACGGLDESSNRDTGVVMAAIDDIIAQWNCHAAFVGHTGHGNGDRVRGASAVSGDISTLLLAERDGDKLKVTCKFQRDADEWERPVWFQREVVTIPDPHPRRRGLDKSSMTLARMPEQGVGASGETHANRTEAVFAREVEAALAHAAEVYAERRAPGAPARNPLSTESLAEIVYDRRRAEDGREDNEDTKARERDSVARRLRRGAEEKTTKKKGTKPAPLGRFVVKGTEGSNLRWVLPEEQGGKAA